MTLVVIIYGVGFRLYKIVMINDLSWLMHGFTWKSVTTGLTHCAAIAESKFLIHFLALVITQGVEIQWQLAIYLSSQASLTFQPLTFDPLDLCPYVFRLMNAFFLPPRQLLVSVHSSMVWKSTVIHHDWHLVSIILSQGRVNGCLVMHLKGLDCLKMFSSADGKLQQPRLTQPSDA